MNLQALNLFGIGLDTVLVSCSESNLHLGRQDGETVMDHVFGEETSTKQVTWTGTDVGLYSSIHNVTYLTYLLMSSTVRSVV